MPSIEPLKEPGYEYPQSKTEIMPKLPIHIVGGPVQVSFIQQYLYVCIACPT
jgi:hypothetical protein